MSIYVNYSISWPIAVLLSSLLSVSFVLSLYVWRICGYNTSNRDDPLTIKQRFFSVFIVCLYSPLIVACFATIISTQMTEINDPFQILTYYEFWQSIGVNFNISSILPSTFYSLLLMIVLYIGPIVESPHTFHKIALFQSMLEIDENNILHVIRGLIVGPLVEEWVYRSCILSLLHYSGISFWLSVIISPLLFGFSHAHHVYYSLFHRIDERNPHRYSYAIKGVLYQLLYTSIFGCMTSVVFLRTGNIIAPMTMHVWCNLCGVPAFTWIMNGMKAMRDYVNMVAYVIGLGSFFISIWYFTDPIYFQSPFV